MFLFLLAALQPLLDERPPREDVHRFPPVWVVERQLEANRLYREHLESRQAFLVSHYWSFQVVLAETNLLHEIWDTLRWAQRYDTPEYQRDMLHRLRELLGPEAYYAGRLPPCLPLHRLTPRE